jgi:uncharacterized membrane protein (Fun14 family)
MTIENLTPIITSSVGGFFIGIILGYFLKKVIKIIMFVTGGVIALMLYLQYQQIISVNIERLEDSSTFIHTSIVSWFDTMTQIGDTTSLGIPLAGGLSAGLVIGLMKG